MKTIINQKVTLSQPAMNVYGQAMVDKNDEPIINTLDKTYGALITDCINRPSDPKQGFSYDDIENIAEVKKAIKESKESGEIKLEDEYYKFLKGRVETMQWGWADIEFVNFKKYILACEKNKPKKTVDAEATEAEASKN